MTMNRRTKLITAGVLVVAVIGGGAGIAIAGGGGDDDEAPITGDALEKATAAALEHTGEGEVSETEVGDEEGFYEVEVTLDDGSQVDVHLDEDFQVLGTEADAHDREDDQGDD